MSITDTTTNDLDAGLRDRVRGIMAETFGMDATELSDDASQATCERWTSLYHLTLLTVLEERLDVSLALDEMTSMTSLPLIVAVLKGHGVRA